MSREEYEAGFVMFDGDKDGKIEKFEFLGALAGYEIYGGDDVKNQTPKNMDAMEFHFASRST